MYLRELLRIASIGEVEVGARSRWIVGRCLDGIVECIVCRCALGFLVVA